MLSIEDSSSSNPSCSSKPSDLVGCHDAPLPKFCIRDYVFKNRNKDIGINWPFPEQLLQVCLDNGIRDVLPPFEPSSSVRACCLKKQVDSEQLCKCSQNKQIIENVDDDDAQLVVSSDNRRLTDTETGRLEDLVSSLTTVADTMASKVCPVCKSFSSTSNTALNAHMDRCLSSDQPRAATDVAKCPKVEVKPRKKRLMVDIYTTAPHCTLEELDKRNHTNWATDLSLVAPATDANVETRTSDTVIRGDVGDIYVDSNGMKLLILSKFNDSPPFISRKGLKPKTNDEVFKASKPSCSVAKKESFKPKCSRFMEDNPHKKKLRANKGFRGEIDAASEGDNTVEAHQEKEESLSQLLSAQERIKNSEPTTLGHWVCSKRSDLLRKLDGTDFSKRSEKMVGTARKLSIRLTQPDSSNSPNLRTICSPNLSRSSEALPSSPKTKRVNILFNTKKATDSAKMSSCQPSNLNFNSLSLVDGHVAKIPSHIEDSRPSLKPRKSSISKKSILSKRTLVSLEASDVVESEQLITYKKFQKHRSLSGCSNWQEGNKHSNVKGGCHGSNEEFSLISFKANGRNKEYRSNLSENQEKRRLDTMRSTDTIAPVSDNNVDRSPEEHEGLISRNESQIESLPQRSAPNQEVQNCMHVISNDISGQHNELAGEDEKTDEPIVYDEDIQTDTASVQEPHPCFTNLKEMHLDNSQENSSATSFRVINNQDHKTVADMESSGSPMSTYTSAICSLSLEDDKLKGSATDQSAELADPMQDKLNSRTVRNGNKVKLFPPAREPSCSCSQSLSRESQLPNNARKKIASDLFIKTSTLSAFQPCQIMESPTESVVTMASPKSSANVSSSCSNARAQAASYPVLRLMGKDLVVNKEEVLQLPEILPCDTDYSLGAKYISFGLPNSSSFSYNGYYHYPIQSPASGQIPLPSHQRRSDKISRRDIDSSYLAREMIVIDDDDSHNLMAKPNRSSTSLPQAIPNPNLVASQRLFSCFPTQDPYAPRAVNFRQGADSQGSFLFPSPSSVFFSSTQK